MEKTVISKFSNFQRNGGDQEFTLFSDGSVERKFDQSNFKLDVIENVKIENLTIEIKEILFSKAKEENKELVKNLLSL